MPFFLFSSPSLSFCWMCSDLKYLQSTVSLSKYYLNRGLADSNSVTSIDIAYDKDATYAKTFHYIPKSDYIPVPKRLSAKSSFTKRASSEGLKMNKGGSKYTPKPFKNSEFMPMSSEREYDTSESTSEKSSSVAILRKKTCR